MPRLLMFVLSVPKSFSFLFNTYCFQHKFIGHETNHKLEVTIIDSILKCFQQFFPRSRKVHLSHELNVSRIYVCGINKGNKILIRKLTKLIKMTSVKQYKVSLIIIVLDVCFFLLTISDSKITFVKNKQQIQKQKKTFFFFEFDKTKHSAEVQKSLSHQSS